MRLFQHAAPFVPIAAASFLAACTTVPIDPGDTSNPNVTIKVMGGDGQYHAMSDVAYGNDSAQLPIRILAIVEDPQGVKSIDLRVSDDTVSAADCGGSIRVGDWVVGGLPAPVGRTLSGASGQAPMQLAATFEISGILTLATRPAGASGACLPADDTTITVRCRGENWSASPILATSTEILQVHFER